MGWARRLRNTIFGSNLSAAFDEEMRFHLDQRIDDYMKDGMSRDQATRAASRRLGNVAIAREQTLDADTVRWLADCGQDVRHAARALRSNPGFAAVAILTLGLGVGLNTAMFIFADAIIFRPPDLPKPAELVRIFSSTKDVPFGTLSYPDYLDFRNRATTLAGVAAYNSVTLPVSRHRDEVRQVVGAALVSGNYFSVLGVEPSPGRGFRDTDDRVGSGAVAVISHALWERLFQSNPAAIGQEVTIANQSFTVIGVAAQRSATDLITVHPDVYVPIAMVHAVVSSRPAGVLGDRSATWLTVVGRLAPGVTSPAAGAEIASLARSLEQAYPATNHQRSANAMQEMAARGVLNPARQRAAALFLGIAGLVLLIACANVANLLLSHAAGRTREIAVRLALGASRSNVAQLVIRRGLTVVAVGSGIGLAATLAGGRLVAPLLFRTSPYDPLILGPVLALVLLVSLLATLIPTVRATRVDPAFALRAR